MALSFNWGSRGEETGPKAPAWKCKYSFPWICDLHACELTVHKGSLLNRVLCSPLSSLLQQS